MITAAAVDTDIQSDVSTDINVFGAASADTNVVAEADATLELFAPGNDGAIAAGSAANASAREVGMTRPARQGARFEAGLSGVGRCLVAQPGTPRPGASLERPKQGRPDDPINGGECREPRCASGNSARRTADRAAHYG